MYACDEDCCSGVIFHVAALDGWLRGRPLLACAYPGDGLVAGPADGGNG